MRRAIAVSLVLGLVACGAASAMMLQGTDIGSNITVFDGHSGSGFDGGSMGQGLEDQEVDMYPGAVGIPQAWDFEGWFLEASVQRLTAIGGWNFEQGYPDGVSSDKWINYPFGDVFIDIDGDAEIPGYAGPPAETPGTYGYDYVLEMDWDSGAFNLVDLEGAELEYVQAGKEYSNPFGYAGGGDIIGAGTVTYLTGLSDAEVGFEGGDGSHNAAIFELSQLDDGEWLHEIETVHLTVLCGNETGNGKVPDGGMTIALLGMALMGFVTLMGRKRR